MVLPHRKGFDAGGVVGAVNDESPSTSIDSQRYREQLPNRALGR